MSDQPSPATPPVYSSAPPVIPPPYLAPGTAFPPPYRGPMPLAAGPAPTLPRSATLGIVSLVMALTATVLASVVAAIACLYIGEVAASALIGNPSAALDLAFFAPARGAVLAAELSFWIGTVLGVWALVQAIVGIVQQRGLGVSIAAVVIAAVGPSVFGAAVGLALVVGGSTVLSA